MAPLPSVDLDRDLHAFLAQGMDAPREDDAFNALALRIFAWQFDALPPYRAYCQRRSALPQRLRHWTEIPAVPVAAFKDTRLQCEEEGAAGEPARIFRTSGTTAGRRPGEHYMTPAALALYEASLLPMFRACVLPETKPGARAALEPIVLGPEAADAPHSSLWHMVEVAGRELFAHAPRHCMRDGVLDGTAARTALSGAARSKRAACVITTDLALDGFLAAAEADEWRVALPQGSRIVHTGGSKGRTRAIDVAELYARAERVLGIDASWCVNEYGMTELASQFYDDSIRRATGVDAKAGDPGAPVAEALPRIKHGPPWVRVLVVDVHTLIPVSPGEPGLLRIVDLANRGSVISLLTEDVGVAEREGDPTAFRLLGRAAGSEPRGCSLDFEEVPAS
ncbi:MAG: hypothetical protein ACREOU_11465 [Candidatus Eiseniibacteriota bacterium]